MRKTFLNLKFEVPIRQKGGKFLEHDLLCLAIAIYAAYLTTPPTFQTHLSQGAPSQETNLFASSPVPAPKAGRGRLIWK